MKSSSKSLGEVLEHRWKTFLIAFVVYVTVVIHISTCVIYEASCHHLRCMEAPVTSQTTLSPDLLPGDFAEYQGAPTPDDTDGEDTETTTPGVRMKNLANRTLITKQKIKRNWYDNRWSQKIIEKFPYYKHASTWDWFFLSIYAIFENFLTLGTGNIEPTKTIEMAGLSVIMIVGFIFFDVWFLSFSFRILMILKRNRADYLFKIHSIKLYLRDVNVNKDVLNNIEAYFNILWQKKDGVKSAPHFDTLPSPLQMEIMYDINCAHLHRSLLFYDLKEFYQRTLSLFMKHEFLLPGDVLFYQGVVKTNLVIITKGILEILSDEDDESPIIAFQAGTVLGEACLFFSLPAKATVRAAVYTEVKLIDRVDFIRNISNYPVALSYLRDRIIYRIRTTKKNIVLNFDDTIELDVDYKTGLIPIKVLKDRLIERQKKGTAHAKVHKTGQTGKPETTKYFYNLLALYQLSNEDSNIETPVVCLTYNFPWILDSTSSLVIFWEHLVILFHLQFLILYAYQVVFLREFNHVLKLSRFASDVVCFMDVLLMICTSVVLKDRVLKTFQEIIRYQMKSMDFYLNAIPVFPYEYFMFAVDALDEMYYERIFDLLMGIKMLRLQRCWILLRRFEILFYYNNTTFSVVSTLIYLFLITYFSGCVLYLHSCLFDVCTEESWFFKMMMRAVQNKEETPCYLFPFASSLYYAMNIILHLGLGDIRAILPGDMYIVIVLLIFGVIMTTYLMSSLAATMSTANLNSEMFQQEVYSFQRFLEHYHVPMDLRRQVNRFFALTWTYDRGLGRTQFRKMAPSHLRMVVYKTEIMELLNHVPLFQLVDVDFLMDIVLSSKITMLPEGATVCYSGDVDREMFVIQKGNCSVYDFRGVFVKHLRAGDYFGDVEMLFNMSKSNTVRTTTHCKLVLITFRNFSSALSMFPGEMKIAHRVIQDPEFVKEVEAIEQRRMISFLDKVPTVRHKPKKGENYLRRIRESFIIAGNCYKRTGGAEKYWDPFRKFGKWQPIGLLLMPITIHPNARLLKSWILFRIFLLIAMGVCLPLAIGLPPGGTAVHVIMLMAEITAYIEIYLFLHIAYYNDQGLLITHPKLTARNYLTHGFLVDLLACLPYYAIIPWLDYDADNIDPTIAHLVSHSSYCKWRATALLQYHRIIGFITYVQKDVLSRKNVYSFMIILPLVLLTLLIGTTIVITVCQYKFYPQQMEQCKWIEDLV